MNIWTIYLLAIGMASILFKAGCISIFINNFWRAA